MERILRVLLFATPLIPLVWGYFVIGYNKEVVIALAPYVGITLVVAGVLSVATVVIAEKGEQLYNWLKYPLGPTWEPTQV